MICQEINLPIGTVGSYGVLVVSVGFIAIYQAQRGR